MKLGMIKPANENSISTGCLSLDVLGVGGVPKGRIIELLDQNLQGNYPCTSYSCRSTKAGGYAAFIDAEHAVDTNIQKD